jgi:flagellar assembly factor FliW
MPEAFSRNFGAVQYNSGEQFKFPHGLPGFPQETEFLPIELPDQFPLLYLQSLRTPSLCFVSLPVNCIVRDYQLSASDEDLACIGLTAESLAGPDILRLALICFSEGGKPTANLRAPILINVKNRKAAQVIQNDDRYPLRYALEPQKEPACS